MRDIVLRQKSIKGFVRDASRGYTALQREVKSLEAQLGQLSSSSAKGGGGGYK